MGLLLHCIPSRIATRRKIKKADIENELSKLPDASVVMPFLVATRDAKWGNGRIVTVAFAGGSTRVHEAIEAAAAVWSKYANLKFDFRDQTGKFRRWTRNDHSYAADIRIAFKANDGFWSAVGTESTDCKIFLPNEPSMNYDGFSRELPGDWKAYVLHEFGHAIGLQHEHQHPAQPCDWRWEDDEGYKIRRNKDGEAIPDRKKRRPGLYTVFGGPPNNWSRPDVDDNLKALGDSKAYDFGDFDKNSIMKYFFEDWLFVKGTRSHCYRRADASRLSREDKNRVALVYPRPMADGAPTIPEIEMRTAEAPAGMSIEAMISAVSSSPTLVRELQRVRDLQK